MHQLLNPQCPIRVLRFKLFCHPSSVSNPQKRERVLTILSQSHTLLNNSKNLRLLPLPQTPINRTNQPLPQKLLLIPLTQLLPCTPRLPSFYIPKPFFPRSSIKGISEERNLEMEVRRCLPSMQIHSSLGTRVVGEMGLREEGGEYEGF